LCDEFREVLNKEQNDVMTPYYVLEPLLQRLPIEVWIWQVNGQKLAIDRDDEGRVLRILRTGRFFELTPAGVIRSADGLNSGFGVEILLQDIVKAKYSEADVFSSQVLEYYRSATDDHTTVAKMESRQRKIQQAILSGEIDRGEAVRRMKRLIADVERWKWKRF